MLQRSRRTREGQLRRRPIALHLHHLHHFVTVGALALVAGSACAKKDMASTHYAEESYGDYGGDGGSGYGGMEMEMAPAYTRSSAVSEPMPMDDMGDMDDMEIMVEGANMSAPVSDSIDSDGDFGGADFAFRGGSRRAGKARAKRSEAPSSPAPVADPQPARPGAPAMEAPPPDTGVRTDEKAVATDETEEPEDHGRQIIYTAGMTIDVWDVEDAMEKAMRLPDRFGGYVHMSRVGYMVLKIPAAKLRAAMDDLQTWGVVLARQLQAQDVTAEFTDLASRIRVLRETQAQLIKLLEQAKTVEEALHVRKALDDVTMQLEVALGRMRQLSESIAFSTLTVQFNERTPMNRLPSSNDPFRWVDTLGVEGTEWR